MIYTQKGLDWAVNFVETINADPSKYVMYKQSRPIANLKHMMVTTTDLYPGNTAFKMKFPGDKEYTSITFAQVLEEMNAINAALADTTLQKENKLADRFIETTDKYLEAAEGDDRLKFVRDQWVDYQKMTAALEGEAD